MPPKNTKIILNSNYKSENAETYEGKTKPILDLSRTVAKEIFDSKIRPWDALTKLNQFICDKGICLPYSQFDEISENVWVHTTAYLSPDIKIDGPTIICGGAKILQGSHISGSVIGSFATVGEHSRVNNSILFDRSTLCGHNLISHSILGYESVLCHGAVTHDTMRDKLNVTVEMPEGIYITGRSKLGAVICDQVYIKPLCVLEPGCGVEFASSSSSLTSISGYHPPHSFI